MTWTIPTTATTSQQKQPDYGTQKVKRGHTAADLQGMYTDGDSVDQATFADMRSNLLLVSGDHYQKKDSSFFRRLRDAKELSQEQKLRLTKNHIRKICYTYSNNIMSMAPGVGFSPKDEKSPHDQKVAELHHSVWRDAFERYGLDDAMDDWCDNFVQIGEVAVKIFFDPNKGPVKGYAPQTDPEGNPVLNELGQMIPDEGQPLYAGEFVFEEVYGFNLLRPAECRDLKKAEWLCIRKMVNKDDLLLQFPGEEKERFIKEGADETYMIFDVAQGGYFKSKNQVLVREFFFRPCQKYPRGYFYIATKEGILAEGELPGGVFPIVVQCFDKVQTTPRGRSGIKQMRPYQAEINRSASKMAEHQITLGDDKILVQNGTKISAGVSLPGVRTVSYTGAQPMILEGRNGSQYLDYMNSQITELYSVMNVAEDTMEKDAQLDPYVLLFRSAKQKKKFQRYIKRFEKFLIEVVKTYLRLAKVHLEDDAMVYAVGSSERVNIAEFKKLDDLCYEVKIEAQSDDIETKLGKQIVLNHALQYVGQKLSSEEIGKLMRAMPFANFDESFDDMTIDYDNSVNDILALDRGEKPPVNEYDNHVYCIKRLVSRMRKADFKFLPVQVQRNYASKVIVHQQMDAAQKLQLQRAEQGFIPTDGPLIPVDFYVSDPTDPTGVRTKRARLPDSSIQWLIKHLEAQGAMVAQMDGMPQGAIAQEASMLMQAPTPGISQFGGMPGGNPMPGQASRQPMGRPNGMGMPGRNVPAAMGNTWSGLR